MKITALLLLVAADLLQASPLAGANVKAPAKAKTTTTTPKIAATTSKVATTTSTSAATTSTSAATTSNGKSPLGPTSGCTPKSCSKCKKDVLANSLLPRGDPTPKPADETEDSLNEWTKNVWPVATRLDILAGGDGETPTSQLIEWKDSGLQFAAVGGLYGCASVVVISDCGVYMTHHWGTPMSDQNLEGARFMWDNEFTNPIQGLPKGAATNPEVLAAAYRTQKDVDELYPSKGWTSLKDEDASKCFGADKKPQAVIVVHDGQGEFAQYGKAGKKMAEIVKKMVPALSKEPEVVSYSNGKDPRGQSESPSDYRGKVIVSYDPAKPEYQVWMAGANQKEAILKGPKE